MFLLKLYYILTAKILSRIFAYLLIHEITVINFFFDVILVRCDDQKSVSSKEMKQFT